MRQVGQFITQKEHRGQLKGIRQSLQRSQISPDLSVSYSLGNKWSYSGLLTNQRLLLFHPKQCSLRYYAKLPEPIPFSTEQEVAEGKDMVFIRQVDNFKCLAVNGQMETMRISWERNQLKKVWIFNMHSSSLRDIWVNLLSDASKVHSEGLSENIHWFSNLNVDVRDAFIKDGQTKNRQKQQPVLS